MEWQPLSPDLNPTENQWSIVKMRWLGGGKQYNRKADRWEPIKSTMLESEPAEEKRFTNPINYRFLAIFEKKGHYIKCKGFKDLSYVFVICYIISVDQFLIILLCF